MSDNFLTYKCRLYMFPLAVIFHLTFNLQSSCTTDHAVAKATHDHIFPSTKFHSRTTRRFAPSCHAKPTKSARRWVIHHKVSRRVTFLTGCLKIKSSPITDHFSSLQIPGKYQEHAPHHVKYTTAKIRMICRILN